MIKVDGAPQRPMLMKTSATPDLTIARVAEELGYADPGSFSRAFKRFAGITPRQFRQRGNAA